MTTTGTATPVEFLSARVRAATLKALSDADGPLTRSEIAARSGYPTHELGALIRDGLIRIVDVDDRMTRYTA